MNTDARYKLVDELNSLENSIRERLKDAEANLAQSEIAKGRKLLLALMRSAINP